MEGSTASNNGQHLCVLVHGLWGNPADLDAMARALRQKHPEETFHLLVAKSNSENFTYDGVDLGGERVCREIEHEVEKLTHDGRRIEKLSVVGYSFGGLVARYAVGLLEGKGFFEKIEPINFTTFATPHLGVRTPLRGWHRKLWNLLAARTLSASGRQLFTVDKFRKTEKPLLEILSDPGSVFMKGLSKFKRRSLYANIVNDRTAMYYTTVISKTDPYYPDLDNISINYLEAYDNVIVDPKSPIMRKDPSEANVSFYDRCLKTGRKTMERLPVLVFTAFYIPFSIAGLVIYSGFESLRSHRRIRLAESEPSDYRVPHLIAGIQEAVDNVYENMNRAQSQEFLVQGGSSSKLVEEPLSSSHTSGPTSSARPEKLNQHETPILALTRCQFKMIRFLDDLDWRKYSVHIHKDIHSHAAMIHRSPKPTLDEGEVVFRHWLDEVFLL